MGRRTYGEAWDRSGNAPGGPGRVGGHSGRSETGRVTILNVRHGL